MPDSLPIRMVNFPQRQKPPYFRYFNLQGLLSNLTQKEYDKLEPSAMAVWDKQQPAQSVGRLFAQGQFSHADGKARFITTTAIDPVNQVSSEYTFNSEYWSDS